MPVKREEREEVAGGHRAGALAPLPGGQRWRWERGVNFRVCRSVLMRAASSSSPCLRLLLCSLHPIPAWKPWVRGNPAPSDTLRITDCHWDPRWGPRVCTAHHIRDGGCHGFKVTWLGNYRRKLILGQRSKGLSTPQAVGGVGMPPSSIVWSYGYGPGGVDKAPCPLTAFTLGSQSHSSS